MKKIALVSLALTGFAAAAFPAVADDDDGRRGMQRDTGGWMSVDELSSHLKTLGYTGIREIERDDGCYEVEARNPDGRRVELKVSRSGDVLRSKHDDDDDDDDRWDD